jgi:hypothetical protein
MEQPSWMRRKPQEAAVRSNSLQYRSLCHFLALFFSLLTKKIDSQENRKNQQVAIFAEIHFTQNSQFL